ncbi:MAG TPA: polysaccharide pyruvyl transferase family protein [Labilithrix sp.]|nr:polysaccharide pyruvyl transferase family protein [Labilithrix sp.]
METSVPAPRICISGSYGGMNLGDEAILEGILTELGPALGANVTVLSRNPADTLARHKVARALAPRTMTKTEMRAELEGHDLLILGGGGILYDHDAETYLREVFLAHELGIPVVVYAISAGPLTTQAARDAVRDGLNGAAVITVRDRQGYRLLEDVGVTREIHLTADPALLLEPEELPVEALTAEGVEFDRHLVGFSVREPGPAAPDLDPEEYHALLAHAADFIVERYDAEVVFVPMEKSDVQHSHGVVAHMQNSERAEILRRRYSPRQVLHLMGRFEFAVGMRLHFLIFAALRGTPFAALPYASKVIGLLEHLQIETPPLGSIGIGQLIARIDRSWDRREEIRARVRERMPELKNRARRSNELVLDVLRQTSPKSRSPWA